MFNSKIPPRESTAGPIPGLVVRLRAICDCLEDNSPRDEDGRILAPFHVFLEYVRAIERALVASVILYYELEVEDGS